MTERGLPPGQRWGERPTVYGIGSVPASDLGSLRLRVRGGVDVPAELT